MCSFFCYVLSVFSPCVYTSLELYKIDVTSQLRIVLTILSSSFSSLGYCYSVYVAKINACCGCCCCYLTLIVHYQVYINTRTDLKNISFAI